MTPYLKNYFDKFKTIFINLSHDVNFENQCKRLEENVEDLFCVINKNGRVKFISSCAMRLLGYEINTKLKSIFFEMYGSFIKKLFSTKSNIEIQNSSFVEFPIKNIHGTYIWLRLNMNITKIEDEYLVIITANDVSKKRHLLEEVDEKTFFSTSLVENLKVGILMEDSRRKIVLANQTLISIFNFEITPEQMIGINYADYLEIIKDLFECPDSFKKSTNDIVNNNVEVLNEILNLKDGRVIERSYFPFKNRNGSAFSIWMYNDATEYHRIFDFIKESENKYRGIFENIQLGVVEVDKNGVIQMPSEIFCKMVEYTEAELIGENINKFMILGEKRNSLSKLLDSKPNYSPELQLNKRSGEKIWTLVNVSPIYNQYKYLSGNVLLFYDITERKVLEESLKQVNLSVKKAEEEEKLFLASMTHELKTPINAILGMSDLLKLTNIDQEQMGYIEILETSTKYLQKLVSDILDISKIESGNVEIKVSKFNLLNFLLEIVNAFEYSLSKNGIKFEMNFDFKPNLEVIADKVILQQILYNLLSNAEKFTFQGSITLGVAHEDLSDNQIKLKFKISDTGIGIDEDMKEVIFEKFKQLPSIKQHKSQGSGLGLNIVKQLLKLQNSTIEVDSTKGKGSTFSFDLVVEKSGVPSNLIKSTSNINTNTHFNYLKILVVEDNELNQQYVTKVLDKWSVRFEIVSSGEEALRKFSETKFDLILMDLQLPGITGLQTASKLREMYQDNLFTIIAMTAVVTSNIEIEILNNGMNDIIRKPFSIADLYEKISIYFNEDKHNQQNELQLYQKLDTTFLNQFYENDKDFMLSVFENFQANYIVELKSILQNINVLTPNEIKTKLHSIKPAFKMVGLTSAEKDIEFILLSHNKLSDITTRLFPNWRVSEIENTVNIQIQMLKEE